MSISDYLLACDFDIQPLAPIHRSELDIMFAPRGKPPKSPSEFRSDGDTPVDKPSKHPSEPRSDDQAPKSTDSNSEMENSTKKDSDKVGGIFIF